MYNLNLIGRIWGIRDGITRNKHIKITLFYFIILYNTRKNCIEQIYNFFAVNC